jgi:glycosyltransferase involved in cell wall biosynthesis
MQRKPDISLIVSSFERPSHLLRCLHSIAAQKGDHGRIEVIVADDGSRDGTRDLVREFTRATGMPITFTSHAHDGFRLAQCRNEGVLASSADYLLFTDGDCILASDHVSLHMKHRRRGFVMGGSCYRLDAEASDRLSVDRIRSGDLTSAVQRREARRVYWKRVRARAYEILRVPMRPRLPGGNLGVWRADFERVNGFDENYVGWGMEDKDIQRRLESVGVRCIFVAGASIFHLWHPRHPTYSHKSLRTPNHHYYHRDGAFATRCASGLSERRQAGFSYEVFDPQMPLSRGAKHESAVAGTAL